jgi:hypothetical protein
MDKSIADLIELIISDWKKFTAFCALAASLFVLLLLAVWLVPKLLHVSTSKVTISSKGSEIELKSSTQDEDQYYLIVSPQASWQPTHIHVKKGAKLTIVADGRVNVDFHGIYEQVENRIKLEEDKARKHPGLKSDATHTPEEYFSQEEWESLVPRHYWSGPQGDTVIAPSSFAARQKYKVAPNLSYGALLGTIMDREDLDSNGQPPNEPHTVFLVGTSWPGPAKEEGAPSTGWLWFAINDVVPPQSAYPNAKGVDVPDMFLLDNLGFYRAVVTVPH